MNYQLLESPFGTLLILSDGQALKRLEFIDSSDEANLDSQWQLQSDPVLEMAREQLSEWFSGKRQKFDLPLNPEGTDFQKKTWQQLCEIPFGQTWSYGEQAKAMGKPTAARAVGSANGRNPIAIIIPCHRVVGSNGSLTGYAYGIKVKQLLLEFEFRKEAVQKTSAMT